MVITADVADGYVRTWTRFVFLRPARFVEEMRFSGEQPQSPGKFAFASLALYAATITAVFTLNGGQISTLTDGQTTAGSAFVPVIIASHIGALVVDIPFLFLAALLTGASLSLDKVVDGKCYSTAILPLLGATQMAMSMSLLAGKETGNLTLGVFGAFVMIVISNILNVAAILYSVGAVAALNGLSFKRLLIPYLCITVPAAVGLIALAAMAGLFS